MKLAKSVCAVLIILVLSGCSAQPQIKVTNQSQAPTQTLSALPTQTPTVAPTQITTQTQSPSQAQTATQAKLQASDAAKAAADADDSGAPYFAAYEYDADNYLVSAYQTQQGPGSYSGGGNVYLVKKATGKVTVSSDFDLDKVDFSKFLTVYSKLSGKIIE